MTEPDSSRGAPLEKSLGPWMLWGLGVGYVISGEYFGWNYGLEHGGTLGLLVAFVLVTVMYVAFVFSYAELACAIPRAGGGFVYALRGLGPFGGYMTGMAQVMEFVFAPPAIAMALGAYGATSFPSLDPRWIAVAAMTVFTALNLWGVRQTALFELVITILAVGELLIFMGVTSSSVRLENLTANAAPEGGVGILKALPFALWFYLAIEGVANAAEESRRPQRDVLLGFGSALATLIVLASGVLICAVGVGGWERVLWPPEQLTVELNGSLVPVVDAKKSDSPLPLALGQILAPSHPMYHLLVGIGGLGLICSLNGILFAAGRSVFEMGRAGFLPASIGRVGPRTHSPWVALLVNWAVGVVAIVLLDTGALITFAGMAATLLYLLSMEAMIRLRRSEPDLPRPYRAPLFPLLPRVAQILAACVLASMLWQNSTIDMPWKSTAGQFVLVLLAAILYYLLVVRIRPSLPEDAVCLEGGHVS